MSSQTASSIAVGVGPLLAALIGAYQLWLKPQVDEERDVPFDPDRRAKLEGEVRKLRLLLLLFTSLAVAVVAIPLGASVISLTELDPNEAVSLPKVLVAFAAVIGVIHVTFLLTRVRALSSELHALHMT